MCTPATLAQLLGSGSDIFPTLIHLSIEFQGKRKHEQTHLQILVLLKTYGATLEFSFDTEKSVH